MQHTYKAALHSYAREFLRLLQVLGVSQADVARAWGVTPPFVTFVAQGSKSLPPHQKQTLRRLLRQAVHAQRQRLTTANAQARQRLRARLWPAVLKLDGAAQALGLAYVASVRALHQETLAYAAGLAEVACAPQVEEAAWQAVAEVENTLASLHEVF